MTKAGIVRKYLDDNFVNKGISLDTVEKKGIARVLLKKHPKEFQNLENTRGIIRHVMGQKGESTRGKMKDPQKEKYYGDAFYSWAEAIDEEERPWDKPFIIPTATKYLTIAADFHSKHCVKNAVEWMLKRTKDKSALLMNGDLLDSESLSRHIKLHNVIDYDKELEMTHNLIKVFKSEFNDVYVKEGNHDFWLERYLLSNARELFRLRGLTVKELLKLGELKVPHIHNLQYIQFHDLDIIHGHEVGMGFGAQFIARAYAKRWQRFKRRMDVKILTSHCHRQDVEVLHNQDGTYAYGWVTPAMCRKGAQYNPYAPGDIGYSEAFLTEDGVKVKHNIYNGK
jgi:hypothetical protein